MRSHEFLPSIPKERLDRGEVVDSKIVKDSKFRADAFFYRSASNDVYLNLAREEYLLERLPESSHGFLLYVNSPSVVFGKHQNPWRECSVVTLRDRGIPLARRISGGGTVYHDLGNLNFSFLLPKDQFDRRRNLGIVVRALTSLGIDAEISSRHDLTVGGAKISGNAFCFRRGRALHHGTLLIRSELGELMGALKGTDGIETFAVESNPSPVVNLRELQSALTVEGVGNEIMAEVARSWERDGLATQTGVEEAVLENDEVRELAERNRGREWIMDRTPKFTITLHIPHEVWPPAAKTNGGERALRLVVDKGCVLAESFEIADGFKESELELLSKRMTGLRFDSHLLALALANVDELTGLARWLQGRGF